MRSVGARFLCLPTHFQALIYQTLTAGCMNFISRSRGLDFTCSCLQKVLYRSFF